VAGEDGSWKTIRSFPIDRSNNGVSVGFVPHAPVAVAFPPTTGKRFRLSFTGTSGEAGLAEIELSGAARVERFMERTTGQDASDPAAMWMPTCGRQPLSPARGQAGGRPGGGAGPDPAHDAGRHAALGSSEGEWMILRTGMTPTGIKNAPASPQGQGWKWTR